MNNNLEEFINNNREQFDSGEGRTDGWKRLQARLERGEKKSPGFIVHPFRWAVAAAIILCFSAVTYYLINKKENNLPVAGQQKVVLPVKELPGEMDTSYTSEIFAFARLISVKENELKQNQKIHPGLYDQFSKDNNKLDSSYNYLRSVLRTSPNKELLLEVMIRNLQLKIELLNRQLQIIKDSKLKKTNNENKTI